MSRQNRTIRSAIIQFKLKNFSYCVSVFEEYASKQSVVAQYYLARCYRLGGGVAQDDTKAVYWYKEAAKQSNSDALVNLGFHYENGFGVNQNSEKAISYYHQALEISQHPTAHYNLGNLLLARGDQEQAFKHYLRANTLGHTKSLTHVIREVLPKSPEMLTFCDTNGNNILQIAAKHGVFDEIPSQFISQQNLHQPNHYNESALDILLRRESLDELPLKFWHLPLHPYTSVLHALIDTGLISYSEKKITSATTDKLSEEQKRLIANLAYKKSVIDYLPEKIRFLSYDFTIDFFRKNLSHNKIGRVPIKYIHQSMLDHRILQDQGYSSLAHEFAKRGFLFQLPKPLTLTYALCSLNDSKGCTPLHYAACFESFEQLPHALQKEDLLTLQDRAGITVICIAYKAGFYHHLSRELLCTSRFYLAGRIGKVEDATELYAMLESVSLNEPLVDGNSALHILAKNNKLHLVNPQQLKTYNLDATNSAHETILDLAGAHRAKSKLDKNLFCGSSDFSNKLLINSIQRKEVALMEGQQVAKINFNQAIPGDNTLNTFYHLAAKNNELGCLYQLAPSVTNLQLLNNRGLSAMDYAADSSEWGGLNHAQFDAITNALPDDIKVALANRAFNANTLSHPVAAVLQQYSPEYLKNHCVYLIQTADILDFPSELTSKVKIQDSLDNKNIGYTLLHLAAEHGQLEGFTQLFGHEFIFSLEDSKGNTPLHCAAMVGDLSFLENEWLEECDSLSKNHKKESFLDLIAPSPDWGNIPLESFEYLLCKLTKAQKVGLANKANYEVSPTPHGNLLIPFSITHCKRILAEAFEKNFRGAEKVWRAQCSNAISAQVFKKMRSQYALDWLTHAFRHNPGAYPPDADQLKVVLSEDHNVQVVARAGSGKTSTISARTFFHIKHCGVSPKEILLLAFNNKAAREMRIRILSMFDPSSKKLIADEEEIQREALEKRNKSKKLTSRELGEIQNYAIKNVCLQLNIELPYIFTFHSLAMRLAELVSTRVVDNRDEKIYDQSKIIEKQFKHWYKDKDKGLDLRLLIQEYFKSDLEIIKAGGFDYLDPREGILHRESLHNETLLGDLVKSGGEKLISNYLLRYAVAYKYEHGHWWDKRVYRPDFTIPKIQTTPRKGSQNKGNKFTIDISYGGVIIEYFGRAGDPKYDKQIDDKREYWKSRTKWQLVELYPEDIKSGDFKRIITSQLQVAGISMRKLSDEELWKIIEQNSKVSEFSKAIVDFIGRIKQYNLSPIQFKEKIAQHSIISKSEALFLKMTSDFYDYYVDVLKKNKLHDFDDDLIAAAEALNSGKFLIKKYDYEIDLSKLKYIYVDEYQDFSYLFHQLVAGIRNVAPRSKFMAVGDDWQAINSFAGSDLKYYRSFSKYWESPITLELPRNYRSAHHVVEAGNNLMWKSNEDGAKAVPFEGNELLDQGSSKRVEVDIFPFTDFDVERFQYDGITPIVLRICDYHLKLGHSIVLLSRTKTIQKVYQKLEQYLQTLKRFLPPELHDRIEASTIHQYKGLESDVVMLMDATTPFHPFLHSRWFFGRILGDDIPSLCAEERRLLYVALTRAKTHLYLLSDKENPAPFLSEITEKPPYFHSIDATKYRPFCDGDGLIKVTISPKDWRDDNLKIMRKNHQFKYLPHPYRLRKFFNYSSNFVSELSTQPWMELLNDATLEVHTEKDDHIQKFSCLDGTLL